MLRFEISLPSQKNRASLEKRLEPFVNYGALYSSALQCGIILQDNQPVINDPVFIIFAGDHGFAHSLPSSDIISELSPLSPLSQAVANYSLRFVDAGLRVSGEDRIDYWLHRGSRYFYRKIRKGTRDILHEASMTTSETHAAIGIGSGYVENAFYNGSNTVLLSGVGAGTELASRCLLAALHHDPLVYWLPSEDKKSEFAKTLQRALNRHPSSTDVMMNLAFYGGYEIAMLVGAILQAAQRGMVCVIDGPTAWSALEVARRLHPECIHYVILAQGSNDTILKRLEWNGLVNAGFKANPALGCALSLNFITSGCKLLSQ
jgi:nicotinate-nucleotide--dimethylbenzimidazole phosphoribosyltransferase